MKKNRTLYIRCCSVIAVCILCLHSSISELWGQSYRLDSLLRTLPSRMQSYEPKGSVEFAHIGKEDSLIQSNALINYYKDGQANTDLSRSSIWASRLSVPLVLQYQNVGDMNAYYEPLGFDALPQISLQRSEEVGRLSDLEVSNRLYRYMSGWLQREHVGLFRYGSLGLMQGREVLAVVNGAASKPLETSSIRSKEHIQGVVETIKPQEVRYRYWYPSFESTAQLSQSYLSDNWYKGGASALNVYMRTYLAMTYKKDKVEWLNELEDKLALYSTMASQGEASQYRISDDLIRLRSNFGLKATGRFYYTLDAEARTQLFHIYQDAERTKLQTAPFAPFNLNVGLGMKYNYSYRSKEIYKRSFSFSANVAPLSFNHRSSARRDINLARQGLTVDKLSTQTFGSTMRATMKWQFNMNVSWESRLYFNTSYKHVEAEWENTLNMSLSRYFSTRLNLYLRYDDSVTPADAWNRYLQISQLISFGFNYKL